MSIFPPFRHFLKYLFANHTSQRPKLNTPDIENQADFSMTTLVRPGKLWDGEPLYGGYWAFWSKYVEVIVLRKPDCGSLYVISAEARDLERKEYLDGELAKYETWDDARSNIFIRGLFRNENEWSTSSKPLYQVWRLADRWQDHQIGCELGAPEESPARSSAQ